MRRCDDGRQAVTLVELVIVMVVSGILFIATPPLVFHGVKTMVFLPKALAVNTVATEAMHQVLEGGFSILQSAPIWGLRLASRSLPSGSTASQPALWLAEASRIGFRTTDGQTVLIRWDSSVVNQEVIRRTLPTPSCTPVMDSGEVIPYHAEGTVRILQTPAIPPAIPSPIPIFRYYNQSGTEIVTPGCPPPATIRRVDIAFTAQTGNGSFDEGDASETITSSVAIRVP